ncbi:MAG: M20/M25/M40 family metallo-hydrolase [Candidatus Sungbacteria bacterium]|nr:M20/M25/M40 family metallo-hydrolase [Candidatus Sungbacteria bacterium]
MEKYLLNTRSEFETHLKELVEMPTVSAEPERAGDIRRCAEYAARMLGAGGFKSGVFETAGNPIVIGQYIHDERAQTVMIYNHLDVQPADKEKEGWRTDPFTFTKIGDKYFGRGTTDDKGPALAAFLAAHYAVWKKLPINFFIVWELEEESGSTNFHELFGDRYPFLCRPDPDVVIVSDGLWRDREHPAIEYGLRGNLCFSLALQTADHDTHSGCTGGFARNPIVELCALISRMVNAVTGDIKIPGIYRKVCGVNLEELENLSRGFDQEVFKKAWGLHTTRKMTNEEAVVSLKLLPTFEVVNISGGYEGPGFKTIVPHRTEAKISMRLVPDQNPEQVLEAVKKFVARMNPDVEVRALRGTAKPYASDYKNPYFQMLQQIVGEVTGKECALDRSGGSIGAVGTMAEYLKAPIVLFGLSLPEHGYHAPNEYFEWSQAEAGIRIFAEYFEEISKLKSPV